MTPEDRRLLLRHMRTPLLVFAALVLMLGVNVILGATLPFHSAYMVEAAIVLCMVATILLFSMEVLKEPPLIGLFSGLGFFWVCIMVGMTLVDYLSR